MAPSVTFLCSLVPTSDAAVVLQSLRCLPHPVVPSAVAQYVLGPYLEDIRCTLGEALRGVTQIMECPAHMIPSADATPNLTELKVYVSRDDVQRSTLVPHQPEKPADDPDLGGQTPVFVEKAPVHVSFANLNTFSVYAAYMPLHIPIALAFDSHSGLQHTLVSLDLRGNLDFDSIFAAPPLLAVRTVKVELKATDRGPNPPLHVRNEVRAIDTPKVMALARMTPNATSVETFSSPALAPVATVLVRAHRSLSAALNNAPPNDGVVPWPRAVELDTACDWSTAVALASVREWQVLRLHVVAARTMPGSGSVPANPFEPTRSSTEQQSDRPTSLEQLSLAGETGRSMLDVIRCFSLDNAPRLTRLRIYASTLSDRSPSDLAAAVPAMRTPMLKELALRDYDLGAGLCEVLFNFGEQAREPDSDPEQESVAINQLVQSIGALSLKELSFVVRQDIVWRPVEGNGHRCTSWRREQYKGFRYARETARVFNQVTLVVPL